MADEGERHIRIIIRRKDYFLEQPQTTAAFANKCVKSFARVLSHLISLKCQSWFPHISLGAVVDGHYIARETTTQHDHFAYIQK